MLQFYETSRASQQKSSVFLKFFYDHLFLRVTGSLEARPGLIYRLPLSLRTVRVFLLTLITIPELCRRLRSGAGSGYSSILNVRDFLFTTFEIADVDNFIEFESQRLKRRPHSSSVSALKNFIRFLYNTGKIDTDFSCLISTPRRYKLQSLPAVLTWSEVMKVLKCIDRSTQTGVRNYAIMLLLTAYGLRAGEVAQMKLDNIDWRKETIHIVQRKMGKDLWLPLIPAAGKAVLEYLKHCRPPCKHRELFIRILL